MTDASNGDADGMTGQTDDGLSPEQATALERLLAGATVTEAARATGRNRSTVYRWLKNDFAFQAAWNARRAEVRDSSEAGLLKLLPKAMRVLESTLDGNDVQTALAILKGCGLLRGRPIQIGSGDENFLRMRDWRN